MTLKLEVGKRYVQRNGAVTDLRQKAFCGSGPDEHRFRVTESGFYCYEDGRIFRDREHPCDVVAEYVAPTGTIHDTITTHNAMLTADKARPAAPTSKKAVLEAAIATVADRGIPYGGVEDNFARIAALWNAHISNRYTTGPTLDPSDVAMMMALMKIARLANSPTHMDSWIDIAGYAACGGEIAAKGLDAAP